jgi:hypothetical protein
MHAKKRAVERSVRGETAGPPTFWVDLTSDLEKEIAERAAREALQAHGIDPDQTIRPNGKH